MYSTIWEYVLEWREKASINDLIVTPIAGIAMGERFYRLIDYVGSAPPGGPWLRTRGALCDGLAAAWCTRRWTVASEDGLPPDALGMSSAY